MWYHIMTEWWVVWTTENVDRIVTWSWKKKIQNFFKFFFPWGKFFSKFLLSKTFFPKFVFPNFFPEKNFFRKICLILLFKNHLWPKVFLLLLRWIWRPGSCLAWVQQLNASIAPRLIEGYPFLAKFTYFNILCMFLLINVLWIWLWFSSLAYFICEIMPCLTILDFSCTIVDRGML